VSDFDFTPVEMENYSSTQDPKYKALVQKQIEIELVEGRYEIVKEKPIIISALGAIPKSNGGIRLIHDASRPHGHSLNDHAELDMSQKFQSLSDLGEMLTHEAYLAKVDLKSAYRSVLVHPDDYKATGLKWKFDHDSKEVYMIDKRLPFGARFSPGIFHRLTQAVKRMMIGYGFTSIVVYLDDFCIVEKSKERCKQALNCLLWLLRKLGFAIAWEKVECPSHTLTFLGIEIDTIRDLFLLPEVKLNEFRSLIDSILASSRISLKKLQSLAGKLNWASSVVRGGRIYLRRILDMTKRVEAPVENFQ